MTKLTIRPDEKKWKKLLAEASSQELFCLNLEFSICQESKELTTAAAAWCISMCHYQAYMNSSYSSKSAVSAEIFSDKLAAKKMRNKKHIKRWNMSFLRSCKLLFLLHRSRGRSHSHPFVHYLPIINVKIIPNLKFNFSCSAPTIVGRPLFVNLLWRKLCFFIGWLVNY